MRMRSDSTARMSSPATRATRLLVRLVEGQVLEPVGHQHPADVAAAPVDQRRRHERPRARPVVVVGGGADVAGEPQRRAPGDDASQHPLGGRERPARHVVAARPALPERQRRVVRREEEERAGVAAQRRLGDLHGPGHGRLDLDRGGPAAQERPLLPAGGAAIDPARGQQAHLPGPLVELPQAPVHGLALVAARRRQPGPEHRVVEHREEEDEPHAGEHPGQAGRFGAPAIHQTPSCSAAASATSASPTGSERKETATAAVR